MKKAEMIKDFEGLVEELTKDSPDEKQVKLLMERLQLGYQPDSVDRIATVLEKMNQVVFTSKNKKGDYDLR